MAGPKIENPTSDPLKIFGRARFLRLEEPEAFSPGGKPRYEATFLVDPADKKGQESIKLLLTTAARMAKEVYGVTPLAIKKLAAKFIPGTPALDLNDPKNADDKIEIPFQDGDAEKFSEYAGYQGMLIAAAHQSRFKPAASNRLGQDVAPGEKQYPYDGSYVRGSVSIWVHATHGSYAKRVGLNLRGVQFNADGDAFTQDAIASEDEFEALEDEAPTTATASDFD
jgi:hypothetical protein